MTHALGRTLAFIFLLSIVVLSGCTQQAPATQTQPEVPSAPQQPAQEQPVQTPAQEERTLPPSPQEPEQPPAEQPPAAELKNVVRITASGFEPRSLTVKVGEAVTWVNEDASPRRPASNAHPTHNIYPEGGGCQGSKVDACVNLNTGDSWSFTFNRVGAWNYHDHITPSFTGTIIVQGASSGY